MAGLTPSAGHGAVRGEGAVRGGPEPRVLAGQGPDLPQPLHHGVGDLQLDKRQEDVHIY